MESNNNSELLSFCAVGDIALCNDVEQNIFTYGSNFPFAKITDIIANNDIIFGNLENVFTEYGEKLDGQAHTLKCMPSSLKAVANANFNIVSLANNHILDYGPKGLSDTIDALDNLKIYHVGAGKNLSIARQPVIISKKGIRIGILAYAMNGVQSAKADKPGAAVIDLLSISEDISKLKKDTDHIILSLHSGLEFIDYPHPVFRDTCHQLSSLGVSLIIGHHPHVINGIEKVGSCIIAYSLGNFIFDLKIMDYSTELTKQGLLLNCIFDKHKLVHYDAIPTIINIDLQPEVAKYAIKQQIDKYLLDISSTLNSSIYPEIYFNKASKIWAQINIAVNFKIIKEQGLLSFLKRLPRLKKIYLIFAIKYFFNKIFGFFVNKFK